MTRELELAAGLRARVADDFLAVLAVFVAGFRVVDRFAAVDFVVVRLAAVLLAAVLLAAVLLAAVLLAAVLLAAVLLAA
ncbi:MAG: hypothetical protein CMH65_03980, partial [Nevskiales bacterium]|nr:hypothetical protein [Nevskiales bacterium]